MQLKHTLVRIFDWLIVLLAVLRYSHQILTAESSYSYSYSKCVTGPCFDSVFTDWWPITVVNGYFPVENLSLCGSWAYDMFKRFNK